jgi:hypothetical protein
MFRSIRRKLVALAVAYAVALGPVVPLLASMAAAASIGPSVLGEICTADTSRSGAGGPARHAPICPMCLAHGCGASDLVAPGTSAGLAPPASARSLPLAPADNVALDLRNGGRQLARAPPRA